MAHTLKHADIYYLRKESCFHCANSGVLGRLDFFKILQIVTSTVALNYSVEQTCYVPPEICDLNYLSSSEITEKLKFLQVTTQ